MIFEFLKQKNNRWRKGLHYLSLMIECCCVIFFIFFAYIYFTKGYEEYMLPTAFYVGFFGLTATTMRVISMWTPLLGKDDVEQFAYLALDLLPNIIGEYPQVTNRDRSYYGLSMIEYIKIEEIYLKRLGISEFVPACRDITLFRNLIAKKVKEIVEEEAISDLLDSDIISIE